MGSITETDGVETQLVVQIGVHKLVPPEDLSVEAQIVQEPAK